MPNKRILFLGGSPCSGKSTVAEIFAKEHGAYYFKVDDLLDELISIASQQGCPTCKKSISMTPEETWMREPTIQCADEFNIYDEISPLIFERLNSIDADFIITEGAAYTPRVMKNYTLNDYITIVPSPDFQISHYKEREWISFVLEGCTDKKKAFDNWMQRDVLFARQVKAECEKDKIPCIINDGSETQDALYKKVAMLFVPNYRFS